MSHVKEEISKAIETLSLTPGDIKLLDYESSREIFEKCQSRFVNSIARRWWWEDFKDVSFCISDIERPFEHLEEFIPDSENHVWLMVEDDQADFYPIYDCSPKKIGALIGECFAFEYYIINKDLKWLLCENHHSRLIGAGDIQKSI